MQQIVKSISGQPRAPRSLDSIRKEIDAQIAQKHIQDLVRTDVTADGLELSLNSGAGVRLGQGAASGPSSSRRSPRCCRCSRPTRRKYAFAVEGHTDSTPIVNGAAFATNWELSSARAIVVRQRLEDAESRALAHPRRGLRRHQAAAGGAARGAERRRAPGPPPPRRREDLLMRDLLLCPCVAGRPGPDQRHPGAPEAHPSARADGAARAREPVRSRRWSATARRSAASRRAALYRDHVGGRHAARHVAARASAQTEGLAASPAQEYLTEARCDFAHEKSVSAQDVQALVRRLEQRLVEGLAPGHRGPPGPRADLARAERIPRRPSRSRCRAKVEARLPPAHARLPKVGSGRRAPRAVGEPAAALLLDDRGGARAPLAALIVIWALRRVGRESLEEKAMLAQLAAGTLASRRRRRRRRRGSARRREGRPPGRR